MKFMLTHMVHFGGEGKQTKHMQFLELTRFGAD
jgi:hypothetical protein